MSEKVSKVQFLERVACVGQKGISPDWVMADSSYVSDNIQIAGEALSLRLVRLVMDRMMYGYILKITPGGMLLAQGKVEEAAYAIDTSLTPRRIMGDPPSGPVATRIYPGGPLIGIGSLVAKSYAGEILRCIATGHIVVKDGMMRAVEPASLWQGHRLSEPRRSVASGDDRQRHVGRRRMG